VIAASRAGTLRFRVAWVLHRASGMAVLLFLVLHVADVALVRLGPGAFDALVFVYRQAAFRAVEIALMAAVLFHAFNGIRVTLLDFWPGWLPHSRRLLYAAYGLSIAGWLPSAYFMAVK
jgi:succinate dehydrogenase / fumarate reductase cytochrome b subunit